MATVLTVTRRRVALARCTLNTCDAYGFIALMRRLWCELALMRRRS
jgi:hypothetical protein